MARLRVFVFVIGSQAMAIFDKFGRQVPIVPDLVFSLEWPKPDGFSILELREIVRAQRAAVLSAAYVESQAESLDFSVPDEVDEVEAAALRRARSRGFLGGV